MLICCKAAFENKMCAFHLGKAVVNAYDFHLLILSVVVRVGYRRGVGFVTGATTQNSTETLLAFFPAGNTGFVVLDFGLRIQEKAKFVT